MALWVQQGVNTVVGTVPHVPVRYEKWKMNANGRKGLALILQILPTLLFLLKSYTDAGHTSSFADVDEFCANFVPIFNFSLGEIGQEDKSIGPLYLFSGR